MWQRYAMFNVSGYLLICLDMAREESPDEGPSPRGPQRAYNPTTTEKPSNSRSSRALDNAIVETDIKTSFSLAEYP